MEIKYKYFIDVYNCQMGKLFEQFFAYFLCTRNSNFLNEIYICNSSFSVNFICTTGIRWQLGRLHFKPINRIWEIKITRPHDQRVMWLYGRKLSIVCNHLARFGSHRYCGSGDKMFLIYNVTSRDHVFKGLCCDLKGWSFL